MRLRFVGDAGLLSAERADLERLAGEERACQGPREAGGQRVFLKGSPLRGKHRWRHALRRALGVSEIPRLQEFANLTWLRREGFGAPRPLLAGVFEHRGLPRFQFLYTALLEPALPLDAWLASVPLNGDESGALRVHLLDALATEVARLHGLGFVHRDLYFRNLLVLPGSPHPGHAFLDAWRGGPRRGWRGPEHDLGCFLVAGAALLGVEEQGRFLQRYREARERGEGERARRVWPRSGSSWLERVERARRREWRRERRRRPGSPGAAVDWRATSLPSPPPPGSVRPPPP